MKTYGIYKISGNNSFCCWIEARSEYEALRKYRKTQTSSGLYSLVKGLRHYSLVTSYGAEFAAVESEKNR